MGIFLQRESRSLEKGEREIERERKDSSFFCFLFWREVLRSQRSSLCRVFIDGPFGSYTDIKTEQYSHLLLLVLKYYILFWFLQLLVSRVGSIINTQNTQTCWSSLFLMASQKEGTAMLSGTSLKDGK